MACCQIWQVPDFLAPILPRRQTLHTNPSAAIIKNDWPTLVFESGLSEGLARLRVDARWWLVNSRSDVNIVIIISIKPTPNPNRPVPTKIQEICVTQNPANPVQPGTIAPCTVTGGSLVLEFQSLYLRAPVVPEGDVIFTPAILSEWANKFWDMTK